MQQPRFFNDKQRDALFIVAGGHCAECGIALTPGWHADHITPFVAGGPTDVVNGQALCAECNLIKGSRMMNDDGLREWQRDGVNKYRTLSRPDFLAVATMGAGKTFFALKIASDLLFQGAVRRVIIVAPSDAVKKGWSKEAWESFSLNITADFDNRMQVLTPDTVGVATTYQAVCQNPMVYRHLVSQQPTVVIFDEIHHAAENTAWGENLITAFGGADRRIALSGTPFRGDRSAIPFVRYDGSGKAIGDANYHYKDAIDEGVCREVAFRTYGGRTKWWEPLKDKPDDLGTEWDVTFADPVRKDQESKRLRTALSRDTEWLENVIREADKDLLSHRENTHPDLAGLVLTMDAPHAEYVRRLMTEITGERPALVMSDYFEDGKPIDVLESFRLGDPNDLTGSPYRNTPRWIIAVKMISEGVNIPRLVNLIYATNVVSPLFFRQSIGRIVRVTEEAPHIIGTVYLPADQRLVDMAAKVEEEVALGLAEILVNGLSGGEGVGGGPGGPASFVPLSASSVAEDILIREDRFSPRDLAMARDYRTQYKYGGSDVELMRMLKTAQEFLTRTNPDPSPSVVVQAGLTSTPAHPDVVKKQLKDEKNRLVSAVVRASGRTLTEREVQGRLKFLFGNRSVGTLSPDELSEQLAILKRWHSSGATSQADWARVIQYER